MVYLDRLLETFGDLRRLAACTEDVSEWLSGISIFDALEIWEFDHKVCACVCVCVRVCGRCICMFGECRDTNKSRFRWSHILRRPVARGHGQQSPLCVTVLFRGWFSSGVLKWRDVARAE